MGREGKGTGGEEREWEGREHGRGQKEWEGRAMTWDGMEGKGKERRKGKGKRGEELQAPNFIPGATTGRVYVLSLTFTVQSLENSDV